MKKNIILLIVSLALFLETVDTTIINTAIPIMAQNLKVDPIDLKLALISYLLSLAIFIPISGWIADKFGSKRVFIIALTVFTLSSIWCGCANNLLELISARIVQGLGGSLTMPIGRLIILRTFKRQEIIAKMSLVVMIGSLGMILGPLLGGIITHHFSWRWIFWVNAPVGIFAIILSSKSLPFMPPQSVHPLDKLGFILFGGGLAILTYSLSMFSESTVPEKQSFISLILAVLLLIGYSQHSRNKKNPIAKVGLFRTRTFCISVLGNLFARMGFGGIPFLMPLFFQIGLGYSVKLSGLLLMPVALGVLLVKPLSVYILRWFGYKNLLILNTALVSFSLCSFFSLNQTSSLYFIGILTFIYGFLVALQYTGMNSLAYANVTEQDMSAASSIMGTIQQLSQSFGVAVTAILVSFFSYEYSGQRILTMDVFHQTFIMLGLLTLLSGIIFAFMKKGDGKELIGT